MIEEIERILKERGKQIEKELEKSVPRKGISNLNDAVWYHLDSGGKRIRPVLAILACESLDGDTRKVMPFAAACELFHSWCLTKEAKILTNPGAHKSIDEIREGDMIYAFDEKNRTLGKNRVLKVLENGIREVYEVRTRNRTIVVTADHPLLVYRKIPTEFARLDDYDGLRNAFKKSKHTLGNLSDNLGEKKSRVAHWIYSNTPIPVNKVGELFSRLDFTCKYSIVRSKPYVHKLEWKRLEDLGKGDLIVVSTGIRDEGNPHVITHSEIGVKLKLNRRGVDVLSGHRPFKKKILEATGIPYKKAHSIATGKQGADFDTIKKIFGLYDVPLESEYYSFSRLTKKLNLPVQTTDEFCQIIGFFLGDGFINGNCVYFSVPEGEIRTEYSRLFEKIFGRALKKNTANECQLACYSKPISALIRKLDLCYGALDKHVPRWVFTLPRSQKLAFIRGYLDSDGTVNASGTMRFASGSKRLIEDLKNLVDSLGFPASNIRSYKVKNNFERGTKKESILWHLFVSNPKKILNEIGTENSEYRRRLDRERKRAYGFSHDVYHKLMDREFFGLNPIISVRKKGMEQVFNLEIENNRNFIANNVVVHNCLVHDDIMDGDVMRRDKEAVWKKFGLAHGINVGDFMSEKVYELIANLEEKGVDDKMIVMLIKEMAETAVKTAEGQAMDMNLRKESFPKENDYMEMIELKTAWYLTLPMVGGAIVAGRKDLAAKIKEFGMKIGPAFQITDDLLDLTKGKGRGEIGSDIREGKRSIMVVHCASRCSEEERKRMFGILDKPRENTDAKDVLYVKELFEKYRSLDYARDRARSLVTEGRAISSSLPKRLGSILDDFAEYLVERKA